LSAVYNTHSNADHIGGNKYLQDSTGCRVYALGTECAFTRHPVLEPSFLYGGYPVKELRHKFLMAQESTAEYLTPDVLPEGFSMIDLPGHFFSMAGFRTPDEVVFLADCLSSRETLCKYRITFIYDVGAYISTLETVKAMNARMFVPSHAEPTADISDLAQYNIDAVNEIADDITRICRTPMNFDRILRIIFDKYGLTMNWEQYVLAGSTVRSYLAWLKECGRANAFFDGNMLWWKAVK
ncbi:MAG: MBL fold metallo-hydrolase, partial [Synergistaceae bacterium]|nr:MBL fold metallo-hydrolase [Synergistaceae bacterium]